MIVGRSQERQKKGCKHAKTHRSWLTEFSRDLGRDGMHYLPIALQGKWWIRHRQH